MSLFPKEPSISTTPSDIVTAMEEASQYLNPYTTPTTFLAAVQVAVQAAMPVPADSSNHIAKWKISTAKVWGYYWLHGILRSKTHNSYTYKVKKEEYKDAATPS